MQICLPSNGFIGDQLLTLSAKIPKTKSTIKKSAIKIEDNSLSFSVLFAFGVNSLCLIEACI
ncbi:hypothetical protein IKE96_01125 [bacterium]|nr:hypothetical protein [bacterium]MBR2857798.1 hypothetical protein [bacterium]